MRPVLRDARGVTVVEFAIILPAMLTLICGTIEMGHMILARQVLEGAVVDAARKATASLETDETRRRDIMTASITRSMAAFATAPGQTMEIQTKVYADFSSAYPETYTDQNGNGRYDAGEPYVDRNRNGKWDDTTAKTGALGGPGDVVSYTVRFPKRLLFGFVGRFIGRSVTLPLSVTTVVRNEAVVRG
ncbi:TadE/TadG family type IV pilus assembly protein [Sphingomonas kyungheensis]|uniref:TadE/TadG family type IV pilus assembly protein n=2 Tax=Sphingomonas TaxID=13687 RepID=A0ABU8H0H7_9SPHN